MPLKFQPAPGIPIAELEIVDPNGPVPEVGAVFTPMRNRGVYDLMFADHRDEPGFNPYEVIAHEEYHEALQQLCWVVLSGSAVADKLGSDDLEEFQEFATRLIGSRPWNLNLLKTGFDVFRNEKNKCRLVETRAAEPSVPAGLQRDVGH